MSSSACPFTLFLRGSFYFPTTFRVIWPRTIKRCLPLTPSLSALFVFSPSPGLSSLLCLSLHRTCRFYSNVSSTDAFFFFFFFTMTHHVPCLDPSVQNSLVVFLHPSSSRVYTVKYETHVYSENVVGLKILLHVLHSEGRATLSSLHASISENGKTIGRKG